MDSSILVLGGGLAGLAAASRLADHGLPVRLIEARDRLGGRLWSERRFAVRVDLGAEFLHGAPPEIARLFSDEQPSDEEPPRGDEFDADLRAFVREAERAPEQTVAAFAAGLGPEWRRSPPDGAAGQGRVEGVLGYIGGFHAADPARMSLHGLVEVERAQSVATHPVQHITSGERAVASLAARLDPARVHLGCPAVAVRWEPGKAEVELADGRRFSGCAVIVTLPVGVLRTGALRFDPDVPRVRDAAARIGVGGAVRVSLCFSEAVWEESFFELEGAFRVAWARADAPVVVAWAGGPGAERLRGVPGERLAELALDALAEVIAPRPELAARFLGFAHHDWLDDPYARGAYSYPLAGQLDAAGVLATPEAGTLFFAGEATCAPADASTVHGAVLSGWRAADEAMAALG